MRKNIKTTEAIFPMPVLMIATYNEDGSVNVMNAAWGTMLSRDHVILNLTETHKTVKNIKKRKAFTVSIADSKHVVEADYFGVVSGNNTPNKFENSGLSVTKSENVDAPIINEFPICLECEFIEYQGDEYGCGVIGKVVNVTADENVMNGENVDIELVDAIAFDPYTHGYYKVTQRVGDAFKDGLQLKNDHTNYEEIIKNDNLFFFILLLSHIYNKTFTLYKLFSNGATKQNRTADLRVTNPLLYQLSYSGI